MRLLLFCLFALAFFNQGIGQTTELKDQTNQKIDSSIELLHDNDFLFYTDRYYTTGSFIGWRKVSKLKSDSLNKLQYRLIIGQEIYTPTNIIDTLIRKYDRPYAGFLGVSGGITSTNKKRILDYRLLAGYTGLASGANAVQSLFHENAAIGSKVPAWKGEIKTSFYLNLYFNYVREWKLQPNPFSAHMALVPKAALGNRDIYLQSDVVFYFGKRNGITNSSAYQQIGTFEKELFFAIRLGYRYVFHNALLEGNVLGDSSLFLIQPYQNLFLYNFEIHRSGKRNSYMLRCNFSTPEAFGTQPHLYASLSIIRGF